MKILIVLNDSPYGIERTYNGLRLAIAITTQQNVELRVVLMGDAIICAKTEQKVPAGYYNVQNMVERLTAAGVNIGACGTCLSARGITDEFLAKGVHRSTLLELTEWTLWADKVINF